MLFDQKSPVHTVPDPGQWDNQTDRQYILHLYNLAMNPACMAKIDTFLLVWIKASQTIIFDCGCIKYKLRIETYWSIS